nr:MAG TPA: hypothetical protein [Bacteriophage sp.]
MSFNYLFYYHNANILYCDVLAKQITIYFLALCNI